MNTKENILNRRSIRKFKNEAVDQSLIDQIIEAGLYAPSARGSQSSIIIQIKDEKVKEELKKLNASIMSADIDPFYGAPVILIVLSKKDWPPRVYDGSCTMENMMLMANDLGLGSVWIHRAKEEFETDWGKNLLKSLGINEEYEGIGHLAIGYSAISNPNPAPRKENRVYCI